MFWKIFNATKRKEKNDSECVRVTSLRKRDGGGFFKLKKETPKNCTKNGRLDYEIHNWLTLKTSLALFLASFLKIRIVCAYFGFVF